MRRAHQSQPVAKALDDPLLAEDRVALEHVLALHEDHVIPRERPKPSGPLSFHSIQELAGSRHQVHHREHKKGRPR